MWLRIYSTFCFTVGCYVQKALLSILSNVEICPYNPVCFLYIPTEIAAKFVIFFCTVSEGRWYAMSFIIIVICFLTERRWSNLQRRCLIEPAASCKFSEWALVSWMHKNFENAFLRICFCIKMHDFCVNVTVHSGISSNGDYNNKTTEDNVWRNGGNTTPHSA